MILQHLKKYLNSFDGIKQKFLSYAKEIIILDSLNLEKQEEKLKKLYSPKHVGRKSINPVIMLQSLILKTLFQETSITKWVKRTRDNPEILIICGFEPGKAAGVGTYYDFLKRLEDGEYKKECSHYTRPSELYKGTSHLRNLKEKPEKTKNYEGITATLVKELLEKSCEPVPDDLQNRLQEMFKETVLIPSAEKGLIDKDSLDVSGDGSILVSGASENGKPACECRKNKIYKCDCPKYYSDPTAEWGYDHYRDIFFFGHKFYQLTSSSSSHDLPLIIIVESGNNTDFTMSVKAIDRFLKSCPEFKIKASSLDSGHDALPIYQYLVIKNISPIISLNPRRKLEVPDIKLSEDGVPLCKAGIEMKFHHRDSQRKRQCFYCPVKKEVKIDGKGCFLPDVSKYPNGVLCKPDGMGPVVYVYEKDNLRVFPPVSRKSKEYRRMMNLRSGCERSNSIKKEVYKIEKNNFKRDSRFLISLYMIAMIEHATAWLNELIKQTGLSAKNLLLQMFESV